MSNDNTSVIGYASSRDGLTIDERWMNRFMCRAKILNAKACRAAIPAAKIRALSLWRPDIYALYRF